jgi:hypoxanthine phosphoribosyltransferase
LHVVIVGQGGIFFGVDLIRFLDNNVTGISYITCSSYKGTESTGSVDIIGTLSEDVKTKDVLIVDDICDTGLTLAALCSNLKNKCKSISTAVLINKTSRRTIDYNPNYYCFETHKDMYLIGYGMDLDNKYRTLESVYFI